MVALFGWLIDNSISTQERNVMYISLAVDILDIEPTTKNVAIRDWAIKIIEEYSEIPLNEVVKSEFRKTKLSNVIPTDDLGNIPLMILVIYQPVIRKIIIFELSVSNTMTKSKNNKDIWDKFQAIGIIFIPIVVLNLGFLFKSSMSNQNRKVQYISIAAEILRNEPTEAQKFLRDWAILVIDEYSEVPLSDEVKNELKNKSIKGSYLLGGTGSKLMDGTGKYLLDDKQRIFNKQER